MKRLFLYIISLLLVACAQNKQSKPELIVFCASSLTNVLTEIAEEYKLVNNIDIRLNIASSGTLARQIEHGANLSVFISANEIWVDYLIGLDLLIPESKQKVAGNSMVVIVPRSSSVETLLFENNFFSTFKGRVAIGDPRHVPAGEYVQQAMINAGYKKELEDRILPAKDVRSAMMLVELGEVEVGIVYKTDALKSQKVRIVNEIPDTLHSPIGFFASIINGKNDEQTELFYKFLTSKEAKIIWIKHGFKIE